MVAIQTVGSLIIKGFKLVLNLVILILYRVGYGGDFLGVGGTWNLNEDKNPDVEIIASGIMVGYFIYTSVTVVAFFFGSKEHKREPVDIIMNFIGMLMWILIGGIAIHYWSGYQSEHKYQMTDSGKISGIILGILCIFSGAIYLVDTVFALIHYARENFN